MIDGPRIHSSPFWQGGNASPVTGSTILASMLSDSRPTEPWRLNSLEPNGLAAAPPLSVRP